MIIMVKSCNGVGFSLVGFGNRSHCFNYLRQREKTVSNNNYDRENAKEERYMTSSNILNRYWMWLACFIQYLFCSPYSFVEAKKVKEKKVKIMA